MAYQSAIIQSKRGFVGLDQHLGFVDFNTNWPTLTCWCYQIKGNQGLLFKSISLKNPPLALVIPAGGAVSERQQLA